MYVLYDTAITINISNQIYLEPKTTKVVASESFTTCTPVSSSVLRPSTQIRKTPFRENKETCRRGLGGTDVLSTSELVYNQPVEEGLTGNKTEVHGPGSIFRGPHMEFWASPPSDLDGPYLKSAELELEERLSSHMCIYVTWILGLEELEKEGELGGIIGAPRRLNL